MNNLKTFSSPIAQLSQWDYTFHNPIIFMEITLTGGSGYV